MTFNTLILFGIFAILQLLDVMLTLRILRKGGRELNPIMAWAMERAGPMAALAAAKLILLALVFAALPWLSSWVLIALCLAYAGVVTWNQYQSGRMP